MLPGFRFLFAAIVLSMSILVFGLGAAALLRAAHEEFANLPSRRAPPEPVFTRQNDNSMPTLALLRVDPPVEERPADGVGPAAVPGVVPEAAAVQAADARPTEPEKLAALKPQELPAKAEIQAMQIMAAPPAAPAEIETPAADANAKLAAIAETLAPPAAVALPPAAPAKDEIPFDDNIAATRIATLGGPAVIVDEKTSAAKEASPDRSTVRKRAVQRARERRRIARRAQLAREAALVAQQQPQITDPFTQAPVVRRTR
jgi:hypothetical protein